MHYLLEYFITCLLLIANVQKYKSFPLTPIYVSKYIGI